MRQEYKNYVMNFLPCAEEAQRVFGIDIIASLAQGAMESNWGLSYGSRKRRNDFGMLATKNTNQYWSGEKSPSTVNTKLWFRIYDSHTNSFLDYARCLKKFHPDAVAVSADIEKFAEAIAASNYISESNGDNRATYRQGIVIRALIISDIIKKQKLQ